MYLTDFASYCITHLVSSEHAKKYVTPKTAFQDVEKKQSSV